ncbi:MAG: 30S ribosomal protein S6 [bacterium]
MKEYETVFITKPDLPESTQKQINERLKGLIEKHQGRLFFAKNMGRRSLAYPIAKQTKGIYTCLDYTSTGSVVTDLERNMRLDDNILRFLTVLKNEDVDVEARAAEIVARGEDAVVQPSLEGETRPAEVGEAKPQGARENDVAAEAEEE